METVDILPKLLECLTLRKEIIVIPALRTIGNIVTIGNDAYKNVIISAGGLSRLGDVLRYYLCVDEKDIVKEAFWAIFKMVDNTDRIQSVINADLLPLLIEGSQFVSMFLIFYSRVYTRKYTSHKLVLNILIKNISLYIL